MKTKQVAYHNKGVVEIRPLGRKLDAQIAKELSDKGFVLTLQNASFAGSLELTLLQAKRVIVSFTPSDGPALSPKEIGELVDSNDTFCDWVIAEAKKYQGELDAAYAADAKN